MSSPPSNDPRASSASDRPASKSEVRAARGVVPGPEQQRSTLPGPGPAASPQAAGLPTSDVAIDIDELERVTLVDLPAIARYGRYELIGRLAYGGMAEIFLAREGHVSAQRLLVIKRVLPHVAEDRHFVDMFIDEARLAMQLNHPNICHVYSFGEEDGTFYIAMEWVNGKPLSKLIRQARDSGGLPLPVALKIMAQVAEALDYAHRACDASGEPLGVVHRDVSPQNIMVSYDGVVKLLDFGIAKATSHSTRTEAGVIKGKFAYMSPQQCVGEPIDSRADIFALGVCLFETLTGKNPFRRQTEFETMTRIVGDPTPSVRERRADVPEEVERILGMALMKQPELRFQAAGDMQVALETVLPKVGAVMNASRVGEYVSSLFGDEIREGPQLDMRLSAAPRRAEVGAEEGREDSQPRRPKPPGSTELDAVAIPHAAVPSVAPQATRPKRSALGPAAIALSLVLLTCLAGMGGVLAWAIFGRVGGAPSDVPQPLVLVPPVATGPTPTPVPVPAEPAATTGSVFLSSVPPGATILFGDRGSSGTTPLEMGMVPPGTYDVRLTLEGHLDWGGQVQVLAGQRSALNAQLVREERPRERSPAAPAGPPGQLSVNTQPWSKVYLGNRLLGTTPIGRVSVPAGLARLRLVDRDGNEHRRSVRVPPGEHVTESFNLRE